MISVPRASSDAKAVLSIIFLEFFVIQSIGLYYEEFIDENSQFGKGIGDIIILFLAVCVPNYFIFLYKRRWKTIVREFDKWPSPKKKIGGIIVWAIALAITIQFFLLLFLFSNSGHS